MPLGVLGGLLSSRGWLCNCILRWAGGGGCPGWSSTWHSTVRSETLGWFHRTREAKLRFLQRGDCSHAPPLLKVSQLGLFTLGKVSPLLFPFKNNVHFTWFTLPPPKTPPSPLWHTPCLHAWSWCKITNHKFVNHGVDCMEKMTILVDFMWSSGESRPDRPSGNCWPLPSLLSGKSRESEREEGRERQTDGQTEDHTAKIHPVLSAKRSTSK